ncbi:plastocyanin/azurin family copper-binding protein [Gracilimonas sp.]|uniref:cupredoxin domain-containing protein n=1 Tax=Gracilimonas sp. TaxID=1974203 RepID=UPI002871537D|nr:plastocyanin/azurin family copper-binding protein [Gracilimonas sp.]
MKTLVHIFVILLFANPISVYGNPPDTLTVKVLGTAEDARFEPVVLQIQPGDVIRFEVVEGLHTVTAYHPDNRRPLRIPETAQSFDSDLLRAGDIWLLKLDKEGVYDYFCLPHERMGHAGRIISGTEICAPNFEDSLIPEAVLKTLNNAEKQIKNR